MSSLAQRLLWTAFVLTLGLGILFDICAVPEGRSRVNIIPPSGLGFKSHEMTLSPSELSIYKKADVIKRCYQLGSDRFILIAIDGSKNRHAVHDPVYCLQGAGWHIQEKKELPIQGGHAMLLKLKKQGQYRQTVYWFSNGTTRSTSVVWFWFHATLRRLSLGHYCKEPILIMLQSYEGNRPYWSEILDKFGLLLDI